ncbi:nuclear body protein SP140-like protein isoform X2 [Sparus aurata]|uniref:nuclear body protein SP140-like protein isoform X2 n=1 Tax=Sparus aurata TaxID=8175 RepID=UPI0011C193CC|nr:nuclear body protein SP140-like protein isoform X2 [Sparus aurata]
MDQLHDLETEKLLRFLHVKKTELSCTENPLTLISQLRDHDLIPEDRYKKMKRMRSKDKMKKAFYEALDWLERERSQHIRLFWRSVFKDAIMKQYPTLQLLHYSLMNGSFESDIQLPEKVEKEDTDKRKGKESSEDEEGEVKKANSGKRKRKQNRKIVSDEEEEQAGPSSPVKKKSKKICFSSPLKKGEKSEIWTWAFFKSQLLVTCGRQEGTLYRDKLAKGEKCIMVNKEWFTPAEFEELAGKRSSRNWRKSIRCKGTPLGKLIQEGHLKSVRYRGSKTAKKSLFPSEDLNTVSEDEDDEDENEESDQDNEDQDSSSSREGGTDEEEETEEQTEQQSEARHDSGRKVFNVTCGALTGTLHKHRFASGYRGKSIRTETSWMTPVEFAKLASGQADSCWRKDIRWEGKPLGVLTEAKILAIHSLRCPCTRCSPDSKDLENQKNDDVCCICKSEGQEEEEEEEELVMCDRCPRSFHQKCHLPHVEEAVLGDSTLWMCTFCVFGSNRGCYYRDELTGEAALSRQISQHMLECQYLLLRLCCADEEQTFAKDPNLYLSDYSSVIETPMWLGSVADKLQKQLYQTVGEFVSDVQLVFTNCASYNREDAEILATGNRLKELFDREFKNVFNISE